MVEPLIERRRLHWIEETYKEYASETTPKQLLTVANWHKAALALALSSGRTRQTLHGKNTFEAALPVTETSKKELLINGVRIPIIIPAKEWVELYNLLPASVKQLTPKAIADNNYDDKLVKVTKYLELYDEADGSQFYLDYVLRYSNYLNESEFLLKVTDNNIYVPTVEEKEDIVPPENEDIKDTNPPLPPVKFGEKEPNIKNIPLPGDLGEDTIKDIVSFSTKAKK